MRITRAQSSAGMALIIVMIAVISLSILAGIFAYSMKIEGRLAMNSNNDAAMEWMGRSGAEAAKWVLGQEMQAGGIDSANSVWAGGYGSPGISNSPLAEIHLPWTIKLGNGEVTVGKMTDLESQANINTADDQLLQQALVEMDVDPGDFPVVVNSILDWIDRDDAERLQGAESDYYQASDPPYDAKNGPIDDLSELLLVKGVTPEMYWGSHASEYVPSRMDRNTRSRLGFQTGDPTHPGFIDLFTPVSAGRININTAKAPVLKLLPFVDDNVAAEIIRLRAGPDGADGTEDDIPFNNPGEVVNAGLNPQAVQQIIRYCDVRSRTFKVPITATIGGYARHFQAIIVRNNPRDLQVISFHSVE
jgi:general secretion pathway protein K